MKNTIVTYLLGRPIWIECHDGEMLKRRARILPDGRIVAAKIYGKIVGNADGTFSPHSYCEKWFDRETMLG